MTQNTAASIKSRLADLAKADGQYRDMQRLMTRYVIERFMWRIGQSVYVDRFTLKGAMAFTYYNANSSRTTKDADFLMRGDYSAASLRDVLSEIARINADDGVIFSADAVTVISAGQERAYPGYSAKVPARLGTNPCPVNLDISFGEAVYPDATRVTIPALLVNKSLYPVLWMYPIETIIAEKYQTIVRLGMGNTRLKDHHDLYEISLSNSVTGASLQKAVLATFERRATPIEAHTPMGLSKTFYADIDKRKGWKATLALHNMPKGVDLKVACEAISSMIGPLLAAIVNGEKFDLVWREGEWRST
jgi:hypothetical protein